MKKAIITFLSFFIVVFALAQEKPEGLFINSKAADFKAIDQNGNEVNTKNLRKLGPLVVVFYRGNWCPYCSKALKRLQDSLPLLTAKRAQVVVITPEGKGGVDSTIAKTGATFPIVSDEGMRISSNYGVAFKVDDRTLGRYKNAGIDLLKLNHQKEASLPVPAIYVVNADGAVTFRYFNEDYRKTISVRELLESVK